MGCKSGIRAQRPEVAVKQVLAGGKIIRAGRVPTGGTKQPDRGGVHVHAPWGEQPDVPPMPHTAAGRTAAFQDNGREPAFEQMRGSS